ncbi:MAG: metal ABC transporter permease [Actinomycetota bacterium]|nr:metal ABC transporter permease [Actinomycetota bacterium]
MRTAAGLADLFAHPFLRYALLAALPVAALSGLVGYFVVLRSQVFTGDALGHVAFSGALGALAVGLDARLGLFAATIAAGLLLGVLGRRGRADDVVIGTVFAWVLGLGVLALAAYATAAHVSDGTAGVRVLFGSVFGLTSSHAWLAAGVAAGLSGLLLAVARPLLFATVDEAVAAARGVPVALLGWGFLALVGATAAEASQAVGALLLLGLLSAPAGTAMRLSARPFVALTLSAGIAVTAALAGIVVSYLVPEVPPSFAILAVASGGYGLTFCLRRSRSTERGGCVPAP